VDGATNQKDSGIGVVLISPKHLTTEKSSRLSFSAMNNEAEYEVLRLGLSAVKKLGGKAVEVFCDSRLIVGQARGEFEAKY